MKVFCLHCDCLVDVYMTAGSGNPDMEDETPPVTVKGGIDLQTRAVFSGTYAEASSDASAEGVMVVICPACETVIAEMEFRAEI